MTAAKETETVQKTRSEATNNHQNIERQMIEVRNTINQQPHGLQMQLSGYFNASQ